jgi:transposase InsO family protein
VLLRLPYLALTGVFAFLRLLPTNSTDKDTEILALRHQLTVLQRQVSKPHLTPPDRAFLAALLHRIPRPTLRQLHLIVFPDTILRWRRDLLRGRHARASRSTRPGRPRTIRSIQALVLRLARENPNWGYRRIHGELAALAITTAHSTVWEILKSNGVEPAPRRDHLTWATFLRNQAHAILAAAFDTVLADSGITYVKTGIRVPRMNAIMERWIRTCRTELLDRTLILNQAHLLHALREYERFYNQHRPHRAL